MERLLDEFAEANALPVELLRDLKVVLDEIVSNIVRYAYGEGQRKSVRLRLSLVNGVVEMAVEDDGRAFDPLDHPVPDTNAPLAERRIGGLGVHLVRRLMDEVAYSRIDNQNRLVGRKRRPERGGAWSGNNYNQCRPHRRDGS